MMLRKEKHAVFNFFQAKLTYTPLIIASGSSLNSFGLSVSVGDLSSDSVHVGGSLLGESLAIWDGVAILGFVVHLSNELSLF